MNTIILDYILLSGVIQGFAFNSFTLIKKKIVKVVIFLNAVVLALSLNNLQAWLIDVDLSSEVFFIKQLLIPWYSLIAPMFFLFLIHYFKIEEKYRYVLKYVLFIFFAQVLLRITLIIYTMYYGNTNDTSLINNYTTIEEIINAIIAIVVFIKSIQIVYFKTSLHTFIKSYDNINWLKLFLKLGLIVILFWIFAIIANLLYTTINWANYPLRFSTSILLYWIGYQGIYKYDLLRERIALRAAILKKEKSEYSFTIKESKLECKTTKHLEDFKIIDAYVVKNKLYLDANYSQEALSEALNMSVSHISKVVNNCHYSNFSDYINFFRIEKAKKMLSNPEFKNYTIIAIALESGFNSKSTFYTSFKKLTSMTPTQFKNSLNKNNVV